MNTSDHILFLLKTRGASTAQQLAEQLQLTSMAVRRHLEQSQQKGLLLTEDRADKVGRPARYWLLSEAGHARFPDRHSELTVQLIEQVRTLFGQAGLDKLIAAREQTSQTSYVARMAGKKTLEQRLAAPVAESLKKWHAMVAEGDLVAFRSAGAYGAVMSSEYNTRPLIPEVLVKGDHFAVIRARPSFDEILNRDSIPSWL